MLAAVRRQTHIPGADPANGSDRERRSGKKRCWVLRGGSRQSRLRVRRDALSGHPFLEFERLSHVAANLQSLFVRAGKVICFCSPNEQ
jgi:hypothetical protein